MRKSASDENKQILNQFNNIYMNSYKIYLKVKINGYSSLYVIIPL